ncbi:hypothetical protein [Brevundimonas sp. DWR2-3-1b1]
MEAILAVLFVAAVVSVAIYAFTRKPKPSGAVRPRGPQSPAKPRGED